MFALLFALVAIVRGSGDTPMKLVQLLAGGYLARLFIQLFIRDVDFLFSHGGGGDYAAYENNAEMIALIWKYGPFEYITNEQIPAIGPTSLPPNLFGLIVYINGGRTALGCTALIAFCACLACLNIYRLAVELGAGEQAAFRVTALLLYAP